IRARDRAKGKNRAIVSAISSLLGVPDLRVVMTEGGEARLEGEGLEQLEQLLRRKPNDGPAPSGGISREKLAEKIAEARRPLERRIEALQRHVQQLSVVEPLRAALAAEGAIDPVGDGSYSDQVSLLRGRI